MTTESLRILLRDLITMRKRLSVERSGRNEDKAYQAIVVATDAIQDELEVRTIKELERFNLDRDITLSKLLNREGNEHESI